MEYLSFTDNRTENNVNNQAGNKGAYKESIGFTGPKKVYSYLLRFTS